jgi:type II secretory pathway pseudopilin PulG
VHVKKSKEGYSLVELMLVLVLITTIILLSIQQYEVYKRDGDVEDLKSKIGGIFRAMNNYYKAQCFGQWTNPTTSATNVTPGTLNPNTTPTPAAIVPVNIQTTLANYYYTIPTSPILDTSVGWNGFLAQYNQYVTTTATIWAMQVSVKINDTRASELQAFLVLLGGDCLSSPGPIAGTIIPCTVTNNAPTKAYVVWQQMPSQIYDPGASPLWASTPQVRSFVQMYRPGNATNTLCGT